MEVILKHLLEEVESAKNDFSDMFSPNRDNSICTDFMGDSNKPTTSFISQELNATRENLLMEIDSKLQGQMSEVFDKKIALLINTKFDALNTNLNKRLDIIKIKLLKSIGDLPIIEENNTSSIILTSIKLNTQVTSSTSSHSSLSYTPYAN